MADKSENLDPIEFVGRDWKVFDGNAGAGDDTGIVTFVKENGTFTLQVRDNSRGLLHEIPGFEFEPRTKTLVLGGRIRAISFWDGDDLGQIPDRIFGARKGVSKDDRLPLEKGDKGSWGAEAG